MHPSICLLFDAIGSSPQVMVCVKDAGGRYVEANDAFVRRARRRDRSDVVGRTAADLFPAELAATYDAQDRAVLVGALDVRNHLELIADHAGDERWYLTTKVVDTDAEHGPLVVVVSVEAGLGASTASGLSAAIALAQRASGTGVTVADLAAAADMSTDRLERAMRRVLGTSPKQYLLRLRAERAAAMLATTQLALADVAATCGYCDQAQMTRQFRAHIGTTPAAYRAMVAG